MQTNNTQRTFSNFCGSLFTGRHFELVGLRDSQAASKLCLAPLSSRITAVKVAADFRPADEGSLIRDLESMNLLAGVQEDHFNACGINDKEIRTVLFGGHLRNCLDEIVTSLPVLLMTGKPVEALIPLDLVYDSSTDFDSLTDPGLAMEAFDAKAGFYLNRKSKVFAVLDGQPKINYAVLFNDEPIEFRMAGKTIVQPFVLRLFSDCELMLEHLSLTASLVTDENDLNILRFPVAHRFEHNHINREKHAEFGFDILRPEVFFCNAPVVTAAISDLLDKIGWNLASILPGVAKFTLPSKSGNFILDIIDTARPGKGIELVFLIRDPMAPRSSAFVRGVIKSRPK